MIKFHKVSEGQWDKDFTVEICDKNGNPKEYKWVYPYNPYDEIKLPKRATKFSAGYDIYSPVDFKLEPGDIIKLPLGIRVEMNDNVFLMIVPRSGLGFKYGFQLTNTCGIIDKDYFYSDNEGHIHGKFINTLHKTLEIKKGEAICQGIFMNYLITDDDNANGIRNGGFGSTSKG